MADRLSDLAALAAAQLGIPLINVPLSPVDPRDALDQIRDRLSEEAQARADEERLEEIAAQYFYQREIEL